MRTTSYQREPPYTTWTSLISEMEAGHLQFIISVTHHQYISPLFLFFTNGFDLRSTNRTDNKSTLYPPRQFHLWACTPSGAAVEVFSLSGCLGSVTGGWSRLCAAVEARLVYSVAFDGVNGQKHSKSETLFRFFSSPYQERPLHSFEWNSYAPTHMVAAISRS